MLGVVPAAGRATRLQPLGTSKEMIHVMGRPVMDHVIERMRVAGCEDIVVVTRSEKRDVLERAAMLGARVITGHPPTMTASIENALRGISPAEEVLLGLPDTVWEPANGFERLLESLRAPFEVVLGLFGGADPRRSEVVEIDGSGIVTAVHIRPRSAGGRWIWGCAVARAGAFAGIALLPELGHRLDDLGRQGRVRGVPLSDRYIDIGTPDAVRRLRSREGSAT